MITRSGALMQWVYFRGRTRGRDRQMLEGGECMGGSDIRLWVMRVCLCFFDYS